MWFEEIRVDLISEMLARLEMLLSTDAELGSLIVNENASLFVDGFSLLVGEVGANTNRCTDVGHYLSLETDFFGARVQAFEST